MTTASATRPQNLHPGAQVGAQPGAQIGAQLPEAPLADQADPMPIEPAQNDVATVLRVMARHGVNQGAMARDLNISPGHMSRICSGQTAAPLPFAVVQYLWAKTADAELLSLFSADSARLLAIATPKAGQPRTLDAAYREMVRAVGDLLRSDGRSQYAAVPLLELTAADAALGAIADYQATLTARARAANEAPRAYADTRAPEPTRTIDRVA